MPSNLINLLIVLLLCIVVFSRARVPKKPPIWWKSFRLYTTYSLVMLILYKVYANLPF